MPLADAPQANKQHAVPQNIMDVEFKLIGDLTMRQFSYLLVCGIVAYISFTTVVGIFKIPLVLIFILLGLGLAFVPIQERGLDDWIASFFKAINMPTQRVWKKEPVLPSAFAYNSVDVVKQELITLAPTSSRRKLEEFLRHRDLEEARDPLDIPEAKYSAMVREAFAYVPEQQPMEGGPSVGVITEPEEILTEPISPIPPMEGSEQPEEKIPNQEITVPEPEKELVPPLSLQNLPSDEPTKPVTEPPTIEEKAEEGQEEPQPKIEIKINPQPKLQLQVKTQIHQPQPKVIEQTPLLQANSLHFDHEIELEPITPDMHSGRRFMNLLPSSGELILPIRGERVLQTSEDEQIEEDINEKAEMLNKLLLSIEEKEGVRIPVDQSKKQELKPVTTPVKQEEAEVKPEIKQVVQVTQEAEGVVEELKGKNEKLTNEMEKLRNEIAQNKSMSKETTNQEQRLHDLENQKEKITSNYDELAKKYQELLQRLDEKNKASLTAANQPTKVTANISDVLSKVQFVQKPDVVSGVVMDKDRKFIPDVLLIIKNKRSEPVRAFKTNTLGQFVLLTPLDRGRYTIEISQSNNLGLTFDIISIEVNGEIIPSLEFVGK